MNYVTPPPAAPPPPQRFYSTDELAAVLGVSQYTVRHWRQQGTGPKAIKVGRHVKYPVAEVEAWLAQRAG